MTGNNQSINPDIASHSFLPRTLYGLSRQHIDGDMLVDVNGATVLCVGKFVGAVPLCLPYRPSVDKRTQ
jgi:hypothetical protein